MDGITGVSPVRTPKNHNYFIYLFSSLSSFFFIIMDGITLLYIFFLFLFQCLLVLTLTFPILPSTGSHCPPLMLISIFFSLHHSLLTLRPPPFSGVLDPPPPPLHSPCHPVVKPRMLGCAQCSTIACLLEHNAYRCPSLPLVCFYHSLSSCYTLSSRHPLFPSLFFYPFHVFYHLRF